VREGVKVVLEGRRMATGLQDGIAGGLPWHYIAGTALKPVVCAALLFPLVLMGRLLSQLVLVAR
jgi:hypothetical protein